MWCVDIRVVVMLPVVALTAGCADTPSFGFPTEHSDIDRGRQAFVDLQCHQCHSVAGERLPAIAGAGPVQLELGGDDAAVKGYAELMTSIISPDHTISESYREQLKLDAVVPLDSPMPVPQIDNMTVRQLIDLVAFLDSRYRD